MEKRSKKKKTHKWGGKWEWNGNSKLKVVYTELETLVSLYRTLQISATGRGRSRAKSFTCGFDLARFSILTQASSRSFDFAFSLRGGGNKVKRGHHQWTPSSWREQAACELGAKRKAGAYLFFSALNCCVQSSKSFWFISMKSFRAL